MEGNKCDICSRPNSTSEPFILYCKECKQYMCIRCISQHQKFTTTHWHTVVQCNTLLTLNENISASTSPKCQNETIAETSYTCWTHGQALDFYCEEHDEVFCCLCKDINHEKCMSIKHVPAYLKEKESLTKKCNNILEEYYVLESYETEQTEQIKKDEEKEKKWMERMNEQVEQMKKELSEFEQKLKTKYRDVESRMKLRKNENDKKKLCFSKRIEHLRYHRQNIENVKSDKDCVKALLTMERQMDKYVTLLTSDQGQSQATTLLQSEHNFEASYYVSGTLQGMMQTVESINSIYTEIQRNTLQEGHDNVPLDLTMAKFKDNSEESATGLERSTKQRIPSECLEHWMSLQTDKENEEVPKIPVQSHCQLNIRFQDDEKVCGITGLADLLNGNIILADFLNKKLKLCDSNGSKLQQIDLEKEPRDIAIMKDNLVLVTVPMGKCIQFVEILDSGCTMTLGKTIKVNGRCCGIAYCKNKIYTATQIPTQILILDVDGNTINIISGENLFERPTYTTVFCEEQLIYLSDPNHKCVYGITKDRQIQFKYEVDGPHGITTDEHGNLFVTDFDTMSVHLVSRNGEKIAELKVGGCPQNVFYNQARNRLLVTAWQSDTMETFKLNVTNGAENPFS